MFTKKVKAVLESKSVEVDNEGSMVNYGSTYSIFAAAEKSQSFMKKCKRNILIFRINDQIKKFEVNQMIYQRYHEGDTGLLEYKGNHMLQFCVQPHED